MTKTRLEAWAPYPQSDKHRRAREKEQIGKEWTQAGTLVTLRIGSPCLESGLGHSLVLSAVWALLS
ncbi:MAG: hypothetical protein AAGC96_14410, partial [Pseudomonadota bacterium]